MALTKDSAVQYFPTSTTQQNSFLTTKRRNDIIRQVTELRLGANGSLHFSIVSSGKASVSRKEKLPAGQFV